MYLYSLPKMMIICLFTTLTIEVIVSLLLKIKEKKDLLNIILVNTLTNPILVASTALIRVVIGIKYQLPSTIIFELIAFFTEGFIYNKVLKYKKINGYILSLILNISSYSIGHIVNYFVW